MEDRSHLLTELRLPESMDLDRMPIADAVALMNQQDAVAVAAVGTQRQAIAKAVEIVAAALAMGGRLIYAGAGSSGRLGVLDASECPPTFRCEPEMVQAIIAGGPDAVFRSKEGAEDDAAAGGAAVAERNIAPLDVVLGIAAGGTTPFVHGALAEARRRGAKTIFLSCVQPVASEPDVDLTIRPLTGPEVLTGSTRLKAGTATKLVLNAITTLAMVQLGKVHENLLVDLRPSNAKLRDRGARIVAILAGIDREAAAILLAQADGQVKTAVVMARLGCDTAQVRERLDNCHGRLRSLLVGE